MIDPLSESAAEEWIRAGSFGCDQIGTIGVELEWIVRDRADPQRRPRLALLRDTLSQLPDPLPAGGAITFEPGGQVELSSAPARTVGECLSRTEADLRLLSEALAVEGLELCGVGLDWRPPERLVDSHRYAALEAHYDTFGACGRWMMCNSASVQVSIEAGDESAGWRGYRYRWWLANSLGPVLVAAFANSPNGYLRCRSTRQLLRFHTDPSRTDPLSLAVEPRRAWARYVLDALIVDVPEAGTGWRRPTRLTMRDWLRGAGPRTAALADLQVHLKSVIPPVRPRGHLELRMIDAQDRRYWAVPVLVVAALMDLPWAADRAAEALERLAPADRRTTWLDAARRGVARPDLGGAALACLEIAASCLVHLDVPAWAATALLDFIERYPSRGRCPADGRPSVRI